MRLAARLSVGRARLPCAPTPYRWKRWTTRPEGSRGQLSYDPGLPPESRLTIGTELGVLQ